MPRASIIIATHSRPELLRRAVTSAQSASRDVEVVVVDDASTDHTAEVCRALPGIKYMRLERNQRVAGARNVGLVASTGQFISFLDDDDTRLPQSLDAQIELLEKNTDAPLAYGQAFYSDADGQITGDAYPSECPQGEIFWELVTRNFIPCGSAVFRRSVITRLGLLDDTVPGIDDWDMWVRIAELYPIIARAQPVVTWRQSHPRSAQGTSDAAKLISDSTRKFKSSWMRLPKAVTAAREVRRTAWRKFSENMLEHALWQTARSGASGKTLQALKNLAATPQLDPSAIVRVAQHRLIQRSR